jgi:hypothetical protein
MKFQAMMQQFKKILMILCCYVARATGRNQGHANIVSTGRKRKIRQSANNVIGEAPKTIFTSLSNLFAGWIFFGKRTK